MLKYDKLFTLFEDNGITTYKMEKLKIIDRTSFRKLKNGTGNLTLNTIERLCEYFNCQPNDLIEYIPDEIAS